MDTCMCMAESLQYSPETHNVVNWQYPNTKKKKNVGIAQLNFPGGPVVRTLCFHYKGTGLLPGWGARILHACHVVGQISG